MLALHVPKSPGMGSCVSLSPSSPGILLPPLTDNTNHSNGKLILEQEFQFGTGFYFYSFIFFILSLQVVIFFPPSPCETKEGKLILISESRVQEKATGLLDSVGPVW